MKKFLSVFIFVFGIGNLINAQDTTRLSLLFVGDIMGHDSQIAAAYNAAKKQYDYSACFQFIKPYIQSVDLAIGNLEVTLAGPPYKGYPQFSSPDALAVALKDAGFGALVTANNHSADRGKRGIERTIRVLDSLRMPHTGTFKDSTHRNRESPLMLYKNGFKIALLNYSYGTNGLPVPKPNIVNLLDPEMIRKDLVQAKAANPDFIIVFTHWGAEYQSLPSKAQKDLAEFCFKHGAQLVIGAHPHVIQPMEWRKAENQFVVYSLGNFVSGQRKRYTDGGAMAYLEMQKISYTADSSITTIDSAAYALEWVHRTVDANKYYYVLPIEDGEQKNFSVIKDQASKDAYRLFADDSRKLYKQHNMQVNEIKIPISSGKIYKVLLSKTQAAEEPWDILTSQREYLWGVDRDDRPDGTILWLSGKFETTQQAERYLTRYQTQHPEARVVAYENGVLLD